jgi:hypothetical protein
MIYDGSDSSGGDLLCGSCGHDNPRENRYCGMCGNSFPHRFLPVPKEQSALTFPSVPLEIAPSQLPVPIPEPAQPETAPSFVRVAAAEIASPTVDEQSPPVVETHLDATVPPSVEALVVETEPVVEVEEPVTTPPAETPAEERAPAVEAATFAAAPEEPIPPVAESPQLDLETPARLAEPAAAPPPSSLPEIRRYATPHRETPPARVETDVPKPPAPQTMEPPPDSAGMPTFQAVAEASGAPPISPFEPPVVKDADEERELQEFVASFRYNAPEEAVDELTMRSEVPVLDAEAPVTTSHPSFDDDVPPPPEAGPHPTGEEYYPPMGTPADRSRFLDIRDSRPADPTHRPTKSPGTSFLGLDESPASHVPPDELDRPPRRGWMLWTSLLALLAVFGALGFFEGRAQINHALQGPIETVREQYVRLRQRVADMTASAPVPAPDKPAAESPAAAEPQAKPPAVDQPITAASKAEPESAASTSPPPSPAVQPTTTPDQQPKTAAPVPQSAPATDIKVIATPSTSPAAVVPQKPAIDTQPKSAPDATAAKREPVIPPPPAVAKPKSKPDPGQQELTNAMQASDPAAAAAWLWKATSRGNPIAPVRLADMYIKGKGVPHSCEQALVLLRSEAAKENAPARNRLAALYANGTCVARDRVKAYQLMSSALAVDPTSEWAEQNRKELLQQMTPEERAQAEKYR